MFFSLNIVKCFNDVSLLWSAWLFGSSFNCLYHVDIQVITFNNKMFYPFVSSSLDHYTYHHYGNCLIHRHKFKSWMNYWWSVLGEQLTVWYCIILTSAFEMHFDRNTSWLMISTGLPTKRILLVCLLMFLTVGNFE